jgi:hypothetical protein
VGWYQIGIQQPRVADVTLDRCLPGCCSLAAMFAVIAMSSVSKSFVLDLGDARGSRRTRRFANGCKFDQRAGG